MMTMVSMFQIGEIEFPYRKDRIDLRNRNTLRMFNGQWTIKAGANDGSCFELHLAIRLIPAQMKTEEGVVIFTLIDT